MNPGPKLLHRLLDPRHVAVWALLASIVTVVGFVYALSRPDTPPGTPAISAQTPGTVIAVPPASVAVTPQVTDPLPTDADSASPSTSDSTTDPSLTTDTPSVAAVTYLSDMTPDGPSPDTTTIPNLAAIHNDFHSLSSITGGCARDLDTSFAYALGGQYRSFTTVVALQSNNDPDIPSPKALVTIAVDGRIVFEQLISVYQAVHVTINVVGKSDLVLRQQYRGADPNTCYEPGTVFWANASLS